MWIGVIGSAGVDWVVGSRQVEILSGLVGLSLSLQGDRRCP